MNAGSPLPLEDLVVGARFLWNLPGFLRHPLTLGEARTILHERLERREADFLALVRRTIYDHPQSAYQQLLKLAGCEYSDLERLVNRDGVEGALQTLFRHGVYLTVDEFKGRRPAIRGRTEIAVFPDHLRNPLSRLHFFVHSGGSRATTTLVPVDLASVRDQAVNDALVLHAQGDAGWIHGTWSVPGASAMVHVLQTAANGRRVTRWFSPVDPADAGLHARYRWSARVMRWASLLARVPLPFPLYVPLENPLPIVEWIRDVLKTGGTPHLHAATSSVVRVCQAAVDAGIELRGAQFATGMEPLTERRLAVIRQVGATAVPRLASSECGRIGHGCLAAEAPDEVHLFHDLHAVIQPGLDEEAHGLPAGSLLLSSLRPTARFILLNVSLGDQAVITRRSCGCPFESLGWTTHLHRIRSHEKLTAAGVAFLDTNVVRVLEEILPARFGGGPTDYQLVEEEGPDGRPMLRLLVHPRIGPVDAEVVAETFLNALGAGSGAERIMGLVWRTGRFLSVERQPPLVTASGKILHLHAQAPAGRRLRT